MTRLASTTADSAAFPELTDAQVDALRPYGTERDVRAGDVLFASGDRRYDFHVVLAGRVEIVAARGSSRERVLVEHGRHRLVGEMNLLSGQAAYLDAVVVEDGSVLAIRRARLREVLDSDPVLSELILRALLLRREILRGERVGLKLVGSRFSADTRRLLEFLARNRLPYVWMDLEREPDAEALLCAASISPADTPVVVWPGGPMLKNPSNAELAAAVGIRSSGAGAPAVYDLAVVGTGPAGLAAAVYGASEGLRTVALDAVALGGQAGTSTRIENYLGFPAGLSGDELAVRAALQADKFGARIIVPCETVGLREEGAVHLLELADGDELAARAVIVATGASYRRLDVERLADLEGFGVFYAATQAEAQLCAGAAVAIVGGGNSAGQAAVYLAERSREVHVVVRRDGLSATMSRYLVDQVERHPRITLHRRSEVRALLGARQLEGVEIDGEGGRRRLDVSGLFVFIGADPHTDWLRGAVAVDGHGFVLTGADLEHAGGDGAAAMPLVTSRPGVLAVGDVRHGSIKRVASAVGEGSMAVRLVHEHLAGADLSAKASIS